MNSRVRKPKPVKDTSTTNSVPENAHPNLDLERLEQSWAQEYHDKSNDERERLINELHGVASRAVPESPAMIASALASFQEAIDGYVPETEKSAYYKARDMNSTYVQSFAFRLKFLRAELFDTKKAALRYVRNLDFLLDKFGDYALMRQLYLSDLNNEEKKFLKKGYIQILPFRDSVGRRIIVNLGSYGGNEVSLDTRERVATYLAFAVLADDQTSQRMGAVSLGMLSEDAIECTQSVGLKDFNRFVQALPIRYSGMHACLSNTLRSWILKALLLTFVQGEQRLLTRFHIGTPLECDYALRTFGIPTKSIPRSSTGTIKDTYHKLCVKMRAMFDNHRKQEARGDYIRYYSSLFYQTPFPAIECPEVNSFLVRRNGAAWNYPGNIRVRDFLEGKLNDRKRLHEDYINSITQEIIARDIQILIFDEEYGWYNRITRKEDIKKQVLYIMREIRKRNRMKATTSLQSKTSATDIFQGLTDDRKFDDPCCTSGSMDVDSTASSERRKRKQNP